MIIVNGQPKSGTTFLQQYLGYCGLTLEPGGLISYAEDSKLVQRGGKPWGNVRSLGDVLSDLDTTKMIGCHVSATYSFPQHTVAFIHRNLRDIAVSTVRWRSVGLDWTNVEKQPSKDVVVQHLHNPKLLANVVAQAKAFRGWLDKADVVVSFDEFMQEPQEQGKRVCKALGVKYKDPEGMMFDKTPWVTDTYRGTWSGQLSNWADVWDDEVEHVWYTVGGPAIEKKYGTVYEGYDVNEDGAWTPVSPNE